jgi:hypothetical protein
VPSSLRSSTEAAPPVNGFPAVSVVVAVPVLVLILKLEFVFRGGIAKNTRFLHQYRRRGSGC